MVQPGRPLVLLACAWAGLAVAASFHPTLLGTAWTASGLALTALAALDLIACLRLPRPALDRRLAATLPVGVWTEVRLRAAQAAPIPLHLQVLDDVPATFEVQGLPQWVRLPAGGWVDLGYRVRPTLRGAHAFGPAFLRLRSPLGLWRRMLRAGDTTPVRVFPNFAPVKKYAELAMGHRLTQLGIHQRRRRGEGSAFHQLRDYREGDSLRQIDWKATARMRRLISKDYQEERDQQVVFLLDCGRRMRAREEGEPLSHFDHSLTAILLLAYVALREGDAVGLMTFSGEPRWMPPRKGSGALDDLIQRLYDLQPSEAATDYLAAAEVFQGRLQKRSLAVLVTNLRDDEDDTLPPALQLLRQRHRVVLAGLREREVEATLERPVRDFDEALLHGAVHAFLARRRAAFERLDARGALTLDVLPEQLPVALVNKYLALKRGGAL